MIHYFLLNLSPAYRHLQGATPVLKPDIMYIVMIKYII